MQGSILGLTFFNFFIIDVVFWISKSDLHNFSDGNINFAAENRIQKLICALEKESQAAIEWFKYNKMIVNLNKFEAVTVKRNSKMVDSYLLFIDRETVNSEKNLVDIYFDNNFYFEDHISKQLIEHDRQDTKVHGV